MNATDPNATGPTRQPVRRRATILAVLTSVAALAVLAGCATATPAAAPVPAKIAVPANVPTTDLASLTLNVGDQKTELQSLLAAAGELDDLPYKIKWATFTSGAPELEALNAGAVDFAGTGNTPPIFSAAAGGKIVIVSAGRDSATGDAVLVPRGSSVRTVADLKGKRVAVAKGSSAHGNLLLEFADEAAVRGLTPRFGLLKDLPFGVIATARAARAPYDFVSRYFASPYGIDEDPVTGSAHCSLAPYWSGVLRKTRFLAWQASARGGELQVSLQGDRVRLAGYAVTVLKGELTA